jgi:hypothetical protein
MRRLVFLFTAFMILTSGLVYLVRSPALADARPTPVFGTELPAGYRDWRLISVAHEEGKLNDIRAILGNDIAVKAYREGTLPFPDGAIIARLAWNYTSSEENKRHSVVPSPSWRALQQTCNSWPRTRRSTRRRGVGVSSSSTTVGPSRHHA